MNTVTTPWKFLLLSALIVGLIWPIPYLISPKIGVFFTAFVALAASLFAHSLPSTRETLPYGQFIQINAIAGFVAIMMAVVVLTFLCHLSFLTSNHMCDRPADIWGFAFISYAFFLFLTTMFHLLIK